MNILHFLWRGAWKNVNVDNYEKLSQFFMLIFKKWTAPDDPTNTADMLWYWARIIKITFKMVERVYITRNTSCLRRWSFSKTRNLHFFVFYRYFNDVNKMCFSLYALVQPSWKKFLMILAQYQNISPVFVGSSGAVHFWKSTWNIGSTFHMYQPSHFLTLHVTENAICSWNMTSIVFTERNRCFLIP